jgi:hypothetical protein
MFPAAKRDKTLAVCGSIWHDYNFSVTAVVLDATPAQTKQHSATTPSRRARRSNRLREKSPTHTRLSFECYERLRRWTQPGYWNSSTITRTWTRLSSSSVRHKTTWWLNNDTRMPFFFIPPSRKVRWHTTFGDVNGILKTTRSAGYTPDLENCNQLF